MKQDVKFRSYATLALLAGTGLSTPALAQSQAQAQQAAETQGGVQDIVVTATRQSESLQKVPLAVTALGSERLEQANVTNLQNVAALAPGIQILPQFKPGDAVFQIRGQIQSDSAPTIDPSVGVYFDDVYIARSAGSLVNLLDVARVEVLKGPQGTLFGKNTTGGAIRIVSNQPTHEFAGYAKVGYESFDKLRLEGVLNVPLGETLAARFAGQYNKKSGGYGTNIVNGDKLDRQEDYSLRGSLLFEPSSTVRLTVTGDYSKLDGGQIPAYLRYFIPASGAFSALEAALENGKGFDATYGTAAMQALVPAPGAKPIFSTNLSGVTANSYTFDSTTGKFTTVGGFTDPQAHVKTWGLLGNLTIDLGAVTLKSITAYRHVDALYGYDVDGTQYAIVDSMQENHAHQFSEELLLNGKLADDRLDWTVGGLYFDEKARARDRTLSVAALSYSRGGAGTNTLASARNKSYGAFAQLTYKLTDQLSATGGVRYSVDERAFTASAFNVSTTGAQSCIYTVANGIALLPGFSAPCNLDQRRTFKQWSYTASLNYQLDPSKLVYVRTSRGYRAGGFNPRINAPETVASFKPEIVTDYELGIKADWLDHVLRTNLAVFHSKGSDVQITVNGFSGATATTIVKNQGTRTVNGVEFDAQVRPVPWFGFNAGLAYLDAKLNNPSEPDVTFVQQVAPWSWNVGADVDMPFSDQLSGHLHADLSMRDKMHDGQAARDATGKVIYLGYTRSVALLGARYTLRHEPTGIELSVYGRNLTNQYYEARGYNIVSLGLGIGNLAEPRVVGIELKVPFGARR